MVKRSEDYGHAASGICRLGAKSKGYGDPADDGDTGHRHVDWHGDLRARGCVASRSRLSDATPLAIPDPVQLSSAFASIVNKVQPAVVNISTTQVIERTDKGAAAPRNAIAATRWAPGRSDQTNSRFRTSSIVSSIFRNRDRRPSAAWARA